MTAIGPPPILLVGGTFDPPHVAHVAVASAVADALDAERILFIPAEVSPHKVAEPPAAAAHRIAMLRIALRGEPRASIDPIEVERGGTSFFVDTVRTLAERHAAPLRFLIGSDQARGFARWRDPEGIRAHATPVVVLRPPDDESDVPAALRDFLLPAPYLDVSATEVRTRLAAGAGIDDLVGPEIAAYIREHRLYGA